MATPRVSVVLAAYNAAGHLPEAIESILSQTFTDFEFLIVNDGSTDGTADIIRAYQDPRIRVIHNSRNVGLSRSLNRALAVTRGEYIARQDADDVSEPGRLAAQVAHLDRVPETALLGSWFTAINADGTIRRPTTLPILDLDLRWGMFFSCPFVHSAMMWRRSVLRDVGVYDESLAYALDYEYWTRIASRHQVANLPAYLVRMRTHAASMTSTYGERTREGVRLRIASVAEALGWQGDDDACAARWRVLGGLLRESELHEITPERAAQGVRDLLALHSAMCRRWNVAPAARRRHNRQVRAAIGAGLLRLCKASLDQGRLGESQRLLASAWLFHWPTCPTRQSARLAARMMQGRVQEALS